MSLDKNINPSLVLVQPRKIRPFITERLLMGRKESNQKKKKKTISQFSPIYYIDQQEDEEAKAVLLLWIFYVFVLSCVCYVLCASVYMCFVVTFWERADLLALVCGVFCEFVTFPLVSLVRCGTWLYRFLIFATLLTLLTRQGFENACWHREACQAIQHAFSKPSLVNLISKDTNLVFYLSVYPLFHSSN